MRFHHIGFPVGCSECEIFIFVNEKRGIKYLKKYSRIKKPLAFENPRPPI